MGTVERTEAICNRNNITGWKKIIVTRALNGCGNCEDRYVCMSKILSGGAPSAAVLRQAFCIMTSQVEVKKTVPTWLAREIARILKRECCACDSLMFCVANAEYAAINRPVDKDVARKQTQRLIKNIKADDLEMRVQAVLDISGVGAKTLVLRALSVFINCRRRDNLA